MYPAESLKAGHTGTVTLMFLVDQNGKVNDSKVRKSSGSVLLDEAARNAIALCRFKPGSVAGVPASLWVPVQYVWVLS
jgi:TonB family protein